MNDWSEAIVWIVLIVSVLIYNLVKLQKTGDPKEELLKLKKLKVWLRLICLKVLSNLKLYQSLLQVEVCSSSSKNSAI